MIPLAVVGIMIITEGWLLLFNICVSGIAASIVAFASKLFKGKKSWVVYIVVFIATIALLALLEHLLFNVDIIKFEIIHSLQGTRF